MKKYPNTTSSSTPLHKKLAPLHLFFGAPQEVLHPFLELVELVEITHHATGYTLFPYPFTQKKRKSQHSSRAVLPAAEHPAGASIPAAVSRRPASAARIPAARSRRPAAGARGLRRRRSRPPYNRVSPPRRRRATLAPCRCRRRRARPPVPPLLARHLTFAAPPVQVLAPPCRIWELPAPRPNSAAPGSPRRAGKGHGGGGDYSCLPASALGLPAATPKRAVRGHAGAGLRAGTHGRRDGKRKGEDNLQAGPAWK